MDFSQSWENPGVAPACEESHLRWHQAHAGMQAQRRSASSGVPEFLVQQQQQQHANAGASALAYPLLLASGPSTSSAASRRRANAWTREEEELLAAVVAAQPVGARPDWVEVAKHVPGRTCKQCREKWRNDVRPDINKQASRVAGAARHATCTPTWPVAPAKC